MSIALLVNNAVNSKCLKSITMKDMVEYYNTLAPHVMGCRSVDKFKDKSVGIAQLQSLIGAVGVRKGITFSGDPTCMPEPIKAKRKSGIAGKKSSRVLCMVRVDDSVPALMSKVKVSSFKAAKQIKLSCTPSEPQRKYLVRMGVWERTIIV